MKRAVLTSAVAVTLSPHVHADVDVQRPDAVVRPDVEEVRASEASDCASRAC